MEYEELQDDVVSEKLEKALTDENAKLVAAYVMDKMEKEATNETLEFEFTLISQEKGGGMEFNEKNVWFKFDADPGSLLKEIKDATYENECNTAELLLIDDFGEWVGKHFKNDQKYRFYAVLRKHMFQNKIVKMKLREVCGFEMIDFSAFGEGHNYNIVVNKEAPKNVYTPNVAHELCKIHDETSKDFAQIIKEKQEAGDEAYTYVTGAYKKRFLWDCQIDFIVDFF